MRNIINIKRLMMLSVSLIMTLTVALAQNSGDALYNKGMQLQGTMTVQSQREAIAKFSAAKKVYDSKAKKSLCDKAISVSNSIIAKLKGSGVSGTNTVVVREKTPANIYLDVTPDNFDIEAKGKRLTVSVSTNSSNWKAVAVDNPDGSRFLSVSKYGKDTFEIYCPSNDTGEDRMQTVAVTAGKEKCIVTVTQAAELSTSKYDWIIKPDYEEVTRYSENLYAVRKNNKWGLLKSGGQEVLTPQYDFITAFTEGFAVAGKNSGTGYRIDCIVSLSGNVVTPDASVYMPQSCLYFSEGKMAVMDGNHKYGYMDSSGAMVIRCQFDAAYPFKEGWAPVRKGSYMQFISPSYDRLRDKSILPVDFHNGDMTRASCFKGGRAYVAYNSDFAVINRSGARVSKISSSDFSKGIALNNAAPASSADYSETSDFTALSKDFNEIKALYSDSYAIVTVKGKMGVLRLK